MPVILMGNFRFGRAKKLSNSRFRRAKKYQFEPFYTILAHFVPFWMVTLSKMMGNFKIVAKALMMGEEGNCRIQKFQNSQVGTDDMNN